MTSNYHIQPLTESHVSDTLNIYNHYILNTTSTFDEHALSRDEFRGNIFFTDPRHGSFVITHKADETVAGFTILGPYKHRNAYRKTAEVTVYIHPDHTGQGLGELALDKIHNFAERQGIHVLLAIICTESEDSIRLFEKMGYTETGLLREVGNKFDRWLDVVFYEKILSHPENQ